MDKLSLERMRTNPTDANCVPNQQLNDTILTTRTGRKTLWSIYKNFVTDYRTELDMMEDAVHRLLFWLPHHDSNNVDDLDGNSDEGNDEATRMSVSIWREAIYGLLSANQLAMYCCDQERQHDHSNRMDDTGDEFCIADDGFGFGFSRRRKRDIVHGKRTADITIATQIRIALQLIHSLTPSLLEIMMVLTPPTPNSPVQGISTTTSNGMDWRLAVKQQRAKIRMRCEQLKFLGRICLLFLYWKDRRRRDVTTSSENTSVGCEQQTIQPGMLLGGGLYYQSSSMENEDFDHSSRSHPLSYSNRKNRMSEMGATTHQKQSYRGRRTGLTIYKNHNASPQPSLSLSSCSKIVLMSRRVRVLLGELLYYCRPLLWSMSEVRDIGMSRKGPVPESSSLLESWLITLGIDMLSLGLLHQEAHSGNMLSRKEWNRRRMKLFLYLLRAPVWNKVTYPSVKRITTMTRYLPLLGRLLNSYIWDWIMYWKHPFISEEG